MDTPVEKRLQFQQFVDAASQFGNLTADAFLLYFQKEAESETELVSVYLESYKRVLSNVGIELMKHFHEVDEETQLMVEKHIGNADIIPLLSSTNTVLAKKGKILGIIEKLIPILEIIKKIIVQIIELFPDFLSKFLKKIIIPLLEFLEQLIKRILDLFGNKSAPFYLKSAEQDFLTTHPQWRRLQFETY
ncbi:MAG: hypothetical protein AAF927_23080 [Bacteroidota bacterium]